MENNMIKANTASNETMTADNRSAVEIWRDFVKKMKASKNENADDFMIYASRFESAVKQYFKYCFESTSHLRTKSKTCAVCFKAIFNSVFTEFLTSNDTLAIKIRNGDMSVIDNDCIELEEICVKLYTGIADAIGIQKYTLGNIVCNEVEISDYFKEVNTEKYKNLKLFMDYCEKEKEVVKGTYCAYNLISDVAKYLSRISFKGDKAALASYNCEIGAKNIINDMLGCVFFKDEKYLDSATTVRLISASSSKDKLELDDALITSVAKDIYEALESYINEEPGTLMNIV